MKKIFFLIIILIYSVSLSAQNKVFWIHGLNDSSYSWIRYKNMMCPTENQGNNIDWDSDKPIDTISVQLNKQINKEISINYAILFGHSTGGNIARSASFNNSRIRAIITAGAPNNGAPIVNSIKEGKVEDLYNKCISKIKGAANTSAHAFGAAIFSIPPVYTPVTMDLVSKAVEKKVRKFLPSEFSIDSLKKMLTKSAEDLHTESKYIKDLNSRKSNIPIINIYGNEEEKRFLRLAGSLSNLDKISNPNDTSETVYDESLFETYNEVIANLSEVENKHRNAANILTGVGVILNPALLLSIGEIRKAANEWGEIKRYVEYDLDNDWSTLIGAVHYEERSYTTGTWFWKKTHYYQVPIYENSDGFIPNKCSIMLPKSGENIINIEAVGVNHLEMNRHPVMEQLIRDILHTGEKTDNKYEKVFNPSYN